ncbi:ISL3 family transposase [Skermanella aerolata]|uniref:ISL3 family transposase n=1 Tax=Skermanella aerolata TaxID=393310 RepID=UPI003D191C19
MTKLLQSRRLRDWKTPYPVRGSKPACCRDGRDSVRGGLFRCSGSRLHAAQIQCHSPSPCFAGQDGVVKQWAARRRREDRLIERTSPAKPSVKPAPPPTTRKAARMLMSEPDKLDADERRFTTALLELSPSIAQAVDLAKTFSTMIKQGLSDQLDGWISTAEDSGFKGFARSLRQDVEAVHAALTLPWSTGPVEGQINRLKVVKRTMYGRAGFNLLRSRVMAAA